MTEVRDQGPLPSSFTDPIASLRLALRGHYEIERQIGQGAFATVYLAQDLKHERKVAIKVLTADPTSDTGELRFIREIRLVARLQHPNILPLHDSGHVEAMLYYVMPYVEGETLRIRMARERQMALESACAIARETADALAHAHTKGIVHRDIKPENILLSGGHAIVADFGIARAIDVAGVKQLTMTGVGGPGTPAYMSPEQLLGDRPVDARSDIYSLGCVLYEMLAGKTPFPGKDGFVKRFTEPPPHISSLRRDAPPWLDSAVAKALSKDPADRYATATDFVTALCQPAISIRTPKREIPLKHALASPPLFDSDPLEAQEFAAAFPDSYPSPGMSAGAIPAVKPSFSPRKRLVGAVRAHPLGAGVATLALVAVVLVVGFASRAGYVPPVFGGGPPLDSTRFVVLASTASVAGSAEVTSQVGDSLYDAFMKWEGLPIVPETRVAQVIADGARAPTTEGAALSLARRVGAGKAVWIQSSGTPQTPRLRVHLYDVKSAESRDEFAVPPGARGETFYATSAQRLLGMRDRPRAAGGCDDRTRSFRAWSACNRGHIALSRWDIRGAEDGFREAVNADGSYAPGRLWLAQLIAWRTPAGRSQSYELVRGSNESGMLSPRDRLAATGLIAFFEQRFPSACAAYKELTRLDSLDFLGWYGLGECQSSDSAVVSSRSSPSSWAFRSSWHSAANAYMTALRFQPGVHEVLAASKLQALLPVSSTMVRWGASAAPERTRFGAIPTLESGDTVGFIPYPVEAFALVKRTASADAALRRNTRLLNEFTSTWAERFPLSSPAQEALADALEARAELGDGPPRASAALRAIDSAVALLLRTGAQDINASDVVRLRARKVRVHFKRGEFVAARILADSLLRMPATTGSEVELQWVAALTGRADLAARHWQRTLGTNTLTGGMVTPFVANLASRYFAYAALGICGPELSALGKELESALRDHVTSDIRNAVRADLADRSAFLATPCTNGKSDLSTPATNDKLRVAQQAFSRGEVRRASEFLAAAAASRRGWRPGDISADYVFQDAWLRTQVGDTAAAEASLDGALGALPTFGAATFRDLGGAASFGRAMTLRAEIAIKRGDASAARRWAVAVTDLWASADPPLRTVAAPVLRALATDTRSR